MSNEDKQTTKQGKTSTTAKAEKNAVSELGDQPAPPRYRNANSNLVDQEHAEDGANRPVHVRVSTRQGESAEQMLRRFNYAVNEADILKIQKNKLHYEKPSKVKQREMKTKRQSRTYDK